MEKKQYHDHGLAIGKADKGLYFISFCGLGGSVDKNVYRPNSYIEGDPGYRVLNVNAIEVKGKSGYERYSKVRAWKIPHEGIN